MWEYIINLISDNLGAAFVVVVALLNACIWLTIWCHNLYLKAKKVDTLPCDEHGRRIDELKEKTCSKGDLPCQTHGEKLDRHSEDISRLLTSMEYLDRSIDRLNRRAMAPEFTQKRSPLSITDKGWAKVKQLGMDEMFDRNWDRIKKNIDEGASSKNPYDINEYCIKYTAVYPERFLAREDIEKIKTDAYKEGLPLIEYTQILAVLARDRYFKEYGITIGESPKTE